MWATIPGREIYGELNIPGSTEYQLVSYAFYPRNDVKPYDMSGSSVGVILYTEAFYVNTVKKIPEKLSKCIKGFHLRLDAGNSFMQSVHVHVFV